MRAGLKTCPCALREGTATMRAGLKTCPYVWRGLDDAGRSEGLPLRVARGDRDDAGRSKDLPLRVARGLCSMRCGVRALLSLHRTLGFEDVGHPVISLVARVLVNLVPDALHRVLTLPGDVPRVRILDRELVADRLGIDQRETLGHLEVLGR